MTIFGSWIQREKCIPISTNMPICEEKKALNVERIFRKHDDRPRVVCC